MHRSTIVLSFLASVALGGAGMAAARETPDAGLARLLAGKTPGEAMSCLDTNRLPIQLAAYGDKLVYKVSRKLVYVNQTTGGCQNVARGDALVTQRYQTRACNGDMARTVDLLSGTLTGSCALGDFIPYRSK